MNEERATEYKPRYKLRKEGSEGAISGGVGNMEFQEVKQNENIAIYLSITRKNTD
jgi:hypothetical protein